jgi:DNA-binding transcriptional regulator YdaS (Cro superfamily)
MAYKSPSNLPPDETRCMRIHAAVRAGGGIVKVARALGYRTGESVRQFYAVDPARGLPKPVPAEKCRALVAATLGTIALHEIRPDLYGGLTTQELGYKPRSGL